ncbi:MAG TPA: acyl-CoA dehydrogenase family protein [Thermoplasmata archaeon]
MTASRSRSADPLLSRVDRVARALRLAERSAELDTTPAFPVAEFRALAAGGLVGPRTPVSLGGVGLSARDAGRLLGRLAYRSGTTFAKLALQPEFCSVLADHGSKELVDRYFRPLVRGELLVGNQVTEPTAGSDAGAIELRAEPTTKGYRLSGTKSEVAFAQDAHAAIVYGRVDGAPAGPEGITAFLVPQDLPGIRREVLSDLGERWMRRGTVRYDGVPIPSALRIGEEGAAFRYLKDELTRERALLAAIYLGVGRASWEETVRHVGRRTAFGRTLSAQQAVAFPLVEDWARLDAADLFVDRALAAIDAGEDSAASAALGKWMATDTALTAIDHAIQFHGGRGYSKALPHEQRWRDVRSGAIAHGPSEIMLLVASRSLWPRPEKPGAPSRSPRRGRTHPTAQRS